MHTCIRIFKESVDVEARRLDGANRFGRKRVPVNIRHYSNVRLRRRE